MQCRLYNSVMKKPVPFNAAISPAEQKLFRQAMRAAAQPRKAPSPTHDAQAEARTSEDDATLFRQAVGKVRPVHSTRAMLNPPPPKPVPSFSQADEHAVLDEILYGPIDDEVLSTGDELNYRKAGVQTRVLRKLRRGYYVVQAELDLHGLTALAANEAVHAFLNRCVAQQQYCVRVIHGKGLSSPHGPVIKPNLANWLRRRADVLAYTSARPSDGGTGAVYVLLSQAG